MIVSRIRNVEHRGRICVLSVRPIEHRGRICVLSVRPRYPGPARPQTPRQRFSTPAPRFGEQTDAGKRRFPPATARGARYGRMPRGRRRKRRDAARTPEEEHRGRFSVSGAGRGGWGLRGPRPRGRGFQPLHPESANRRTPANGGFRLSVRGGRGYGKTPRVRRKKRGRGDMLRETALMAAQKKEAQKKVLFQ